jgi:membrane protease YdiL (CAAX protease family)
MEKNKLPVSRMSKWESIFAIGWLPVHILVLPLLLVLLFPDMSAANLNFWCYVGGGAVLSLLCIRFLFRDFARIFEQPLLIFGQALLGFALMMAANLVLNIFLAPHLPEANPNNEAVMHLARQEWLRIGFITVFAAPLLEELMFRGGVFGLLRRWNRPLAYAVCVLLFAACHTWQYALEDPIYWLYLLQYLPAGILLCWVYDRNECIWASVLMHTINNGVSLLAMWVGVAAA